MVIKQGVRRGRPTLSYLTKLFIEASINDMKINRNGIPKKKRKNKFNLFAVDGKIWRRIKLCAQVFRHNINKIKFENQRTKKSKNS